MGKSLNLLFDLDGTLTDPSEGITNCIVHALEKFQKISPPKKTLKKYIGPPLKDSFIDLLGCE